MKPMLLRELPYSDDVFDKYKSWLWQEKHNGTRNLIHVRDEKICAIRNRNDVPVGAFYPEIMEVKFPNVSDAIYDCEICVFDAQHRSIFYGGINQRKAIKPLAHRLKYPAVAVVFDCLYLNGQVLTQKPYSERLEMVRQTIANRGGSIEVVEDILNPREYWDKIVLENREGLVLKNPKGLYYPDKRMDIQYKLKHYKRALVLVEKLEPNPKGVKIIGSFELGGQKIEAQVQWSSMGFENIKIGSEVEVEYLDIVNNKLIQPHKVKNSFIGGEDDG